MFVTGQASNVLVAGLAAKAAGVSVTWAGWFAAAVVPGLVSAALVPALVHRLVRPTVTRTPAAAEHARRQLAEMGPMRGAERIVLAVVLAVCASWITAGWHHVDVTLTALVGVSILVATGVLPWQRAIADAAVWDVFVWYGGLVTLGEALSGTGAAGVLAGAVGKLLGGLPWFGVLVAALLIFHYTHYAFASITTHVLSMFVPFLLVLVAAGAPARLSVFALAYFVNLAAGLTHYGTTTAPIVFAEGYVGFGTWWRTGLVVSVVNVAIWLTVGFGWWKVIGLW
jgi:DASS family divalent anion:Na+ symporter